MSAEVLGGLAERVGDGLVAVRPAAASADSASTDLVDAVATALLGFVSEPGDGVLGRLVGALGADGVANGLLGGRTGSDIAAQAADALGPSDAPSGREVAAGLARWSPRLDADAFARAIAQAARVGARLLLPGDADWPGGVDDLGAHAPLALWVRGRPAALSERSSLALVGARAATGYGEHIAVEAAAGLVDRGLAVVSGGAYGIDGTAHRASLAAGGTTVAFLAGGVDRFYPAGHETLLGRIVETGAVVSELACGAAPTRWRFLQRKPQQVHVLPGCGVTREVRILRGRPSGLYGGGMGCDVTGLSIRESIEMLASCVSRIADAEAPWAWSLALVVPIGVALIALGGVGFTVWQSHRIARRDQLWQRMQWAIDSAFSADDDLRMAGLLALERLADEDEARRSGFRPTELDLSIMDDVSSAALP
ncbi:DNA-processing protein DprA [Agromyces sp. M3QZ16-3]|uniref:DNA-processing protein DprA n=1 Tax=Agromyces sp. M3QZ16-3 TaxID=3447585 RepID=UPI003F68E447